MVRGLSWEGRVKIPIEKWSLITGVHCPRKEYCSPSSLSVDSSGTLSARDLFACFASLGMALSHVLCADDMVHYDS